jgi:hypothetical protein
MEAHGYTVAIGGADEIVHRLISVLDWIGKGERRLSADYSRVAAEIAAEARGRPAAGGAAVKDAPAR